MYEQMHPEPLRSWTDILVLPDGSEDAFKRVPFHYVRFTDDEVTVQHRNLLCVPVYMGIVCLIINNQLPAELLLL